MHGAISELKKIEKITFESEPKPLIPWVSIMFVCLLGFNVRAAIFQLYSDDEHEITIFIIILVVYFILFG